MWDKIFLSVVPPPCHTPLSQMEECLLKIKKFIQSTGLSGDSILKQTFFIRAAGNADYYHKVEEFAACMQDQYGSVRPPTSFIAQPPADNGGVSAEVVILYRRSPNTRVVHKSLQHVRYTMVLSPSLKEVYGAGITASGRHEGISEQADKSFALMASILKTENLSFSHVVRQWNYIESILAQNCMNGIFRQNYQSFNDVRSHYYSSADFSSGYPAATGIGMNAGGVILEFIAFQGSKEVDILPLSNPLQKDAQQYKQDVLVGESLAEKTPPKFERAKLIVKDNSGLIFISGTAAVRGQNTVHRGDVIRQTRSTIQNISELISRKNLKKSGVATAFDTEPFSYLRVYVKHAEDFPTVRTVCEQTYGDIPSQYLVSDICREDLLVEIEGAVCVSAPQKHNNGEHNEK